MSHWDQRRDFITELALDSQTLEEFDLALFEYLGPIIGFDAACASWTRAYQCDAPHITALGYAPAQLRSHFPRYMNELTPAELAQFASSQVRGDTEVIGSARRRSLAVYRELLLPHGVSSYLTNIWHCRSGVLGIHLARTGHVTDLSGQSTEAMQAVLPVIRLGMALLAGDELARSSSSAAETWAAAWNLSERERDTVRLVARGFRNNEIAHMLRVSPNTVRNHLVHIFRKAEVSTRAELLFAMNPEAAQGGATAVRSDTRVWCNYIESRPCTKEQ